jgi:hypothetical protein
MKETCFDKLRMYDLPYLENKNVTGLIKTRYDRPSKFIQNSNLIIVSNFSFFSLEDQLESFFLMNPKKREKYKSTF